MSRNLIMTTEQDFCGSDVQAAKRDGSQTARAGGGSGAGTLGPFKLWLLRWLNESAASEIDRLREQNQTLVRQNAYLRRSNAQYRANGKTFY